MIWITQWLCPKRHCSIALAWDDEETTPEEVEKKGEEIYTSGVIIRKCGVCHGELKVEHGRTAFKNLEEAAPKLLEVQAANLRARAILNNRN